MYSNFYTISDFVHPDHQYRNKKKFGNFLSDIRMKLISSDKRSI